MFASFFAGKMAAAESMASNELAMLNARNSKLLALSKEARTKQASAEQVAKDASVAESKLREDTSRMQQKVLEIHDIELKVMRASILLDTKQALIVRKTFTIM